MKIPFYLLLLTNCGKQELPQQHQTIPQIQYNISCSDSILCTYGNLYKDNIETPNREINISFEQDLSVTGLTLGNGNIIIDYDKYNKLSPRMQQVLVMHEMWHASKLRQGHNDSCKFTQHILDANYFEAIPEESLIPTIKSQVSSCN